jgi:hypothetical protein
MTLHGSSVWVLEGGPTRRLHRIDPATSGVEQTIEVGSGTGYLAVDGRTIWVSKPGGLIRILNTP